MDPPSPLQSNRSSTIRPEKRDKRPSFVKSMSMSTMKPSPSPSSTPATSATTSEALKSPTMQDSPLTLQSRPQVFEPKVVGLYRDLFRTVQDDEKPEGFWRELFLLKPDTLRLRTILHDTDAHFLLHIPHHSQQLVVNATAQIKAGQAPSDENALETLTVFFAVVLAKKYTNPSSDIIELLAGLDQVDAVFTELVAVLDYAIKDGRTLEYRQNAVKTAIAIVAGGYHTALLSYFINIDLFPALMKLVHQLDHALQASQPFLLAGLLANYNKFEVHNQYRVRFADFVNEETMHKVISSINWTCILLRDKYIAILDDTPAGWSIANTLSYVGLGAIAGAKPTQPTLTEDQQRTLFAAQPGPEAASLLALYDFTAANPLFSRTFITAPSPDSKTTPCSFAAFLSLTSYLHLHAHRNPRTSLYAHLTLLTLLTLTSTPSTANLLTTTTSPPVRLCRQRAPYLPLPRSPSIPIPYTSTLLSLLTNTLTHNLSKTLSTSLYTLTLTLLHQLLLHLTSKNLKPPHPHYPDLWRALLAFVRFLNTYPTELKTLPDTADLVQKLTDLLALAVTAGDIFCPEEKDFDDLLYKVVESGEALQTLGKTYPLVKTSGKGGSLAVVLQVVDHYNSLLRQKAGGNTNTKTKTPDDDSGKAAAAAAAVGTLTPTEVGKVIKAGFEGLDLEEKREVLLGEGRGKGVEGGLRGYREGEFRGLLKRVAKVVVADVGGVLGGGGSGVRG